MEEPKNLSVDNLWSLYQRRSSFVLGFHGGEKSLIDEIISRKKSHLTSSKGKFEWLGRGIYFWENDPQRGLEWARDGNPKSKIKHPSVVGAVLDLGNCLDLTTRTGLHDLN